MNNNQLNSGATLYVDGRKIGNVKSIYIETKDLSDEQRREQQAAAEDIRRFLMSQISKGTPVHDYDVYE